MSADLPEVVTDSKRKTGRWRRHLKRTAVVLAVIVLCAGYALKDHIRTLNSLRRIPGTHAYVMDYYVDYNMAEVRAHGIDVNHVEKSFMQVFFPKWIAPIADWLKGAYLDESITTFEPGDHCSTVVLRTPDQHVYFGRNFDYSHDACLVLKVHGPDGIASVGMIDLHYLNLDRDDLEQTSLIRRIPLLFAPYYVHDGMNRYGVAVSEMAVDGVKPPYEPGKPSVIQSTALRLILDYAHSADEAVELLKQFNIRFVAETCHLMIADRSGKSIVIEFIDGQLKPTTTRESWQICTNHQLCGKSEAENCKACDRYRLASEKLTDLHGKGSAGDVMNVMQLVSKPDWTMWSSVYDLSTGAFSIAYRRHYDETYQNSMEIVSRSN